MVPTTKQYAPHDTGRHQTRRCAKARGVKCDNPAEHVPPSTIATFVPRDRALSKKEIDLFFNTLKNAQTSHVLKVALKLIMLTLVRKKTSVSATWDEIDFVNSE
ncbi:hypothetical protein WCT79_13725 [Pectobacterium carotovorum]|uniref:hypothetical protein n=1 Tax=Pectobacterium carotovorum TaxID=554 RepID=UPI00068A3EC5|nr:hypothetical protein [Pectobacterium carotovorum]